MKAVIIVAMTGDRIIGRDGRLPWHLPEDLKFFKRTTTGHAIIMGRKTFDSIGRPLPNRRNVVVTRNRDFGEMESLDIVHSLGEAFELCRDRGESKAFVIGGAQIYATALPLVHEMIITHVDGKDITGDTYFPEWNAIEWACAGSVDESFPQAMLYKRC
ncbi:MAG: dihydrofolate reductase [Phycisphaerales bacterium]|nr:dihydrofolate reductase [Phycisphaerales bacterium]